MAFDTNATDVLLARRNCIVAGVMNIGAAIATGRPVGAEAKVMVKVQVALVGHMDAELVRRGIEVPAVPWA